jgi:hypothetical protein
MKFAKWQFQKTGENLQTSTCLSVVFRYSKANQAQNKIYAVVLKDRSMATSILPRQNGHLSWRKLGYFA